MAPFSVFDASIARPRPSEPQWAIRWLCTSNPFYAISAGLFLAGLWISFGDPEQAKDTWALMAGLVGYTLLLAGTAFLLVRFAVVWDDARTVLLLVVLMFLATSVTFDRVLVDDLDKKTPERGVGCILVGLSLALAVSESVLRGIGLVLPMLYRVPYYLILALFFLYPLFLTQCLDLKNFRSETVMWSLFGFSPLAGLIFLSLLPAIWQGAGHVRDNGSPWTWPMYPWSLFGLLAFAVPGRAMLLCYSMHQIGVRDLHESMFGLYFLVPFGLAVAVLLLELAQSSRHRGVLWTALLLPMGLIVLSAIGLRSDPIHELFLRIFTARLGAGPVYLALLGAACFYGYAAARRVPHALEIFTGALALLAVAGPRSFAFEGFVPYRQLPLLVASAVQLGVGAWQRSSWHCSIGALAAVASLLLPADAATLSLRLVIASQLTIAALLILGTIFEDDLSFALRNLGGGLALSCSWIALFFPSLLPTDIPEWMIAAYPLAMVCVLKVYACVLWHKPSFAFASVILVCWLGHSGWQNYLLCREEILGLDYIVVSLSLFALAIVISLGKSGLLSRWLARWHAEAPESLD